jgi:putative drug exporter of the RND superfamily
MHSFLSTSALARRSSQRPFRVIAIWIVVVLLAGAAASQMQTTSEGQLTNGPESVRAEQLIEERLRGSEPVVETVIVRSETTTVDDPAFQTIIDQTVTELAALDGIVTGILHYDPVLASENVALEGLVSQDRNSTMIQVQLGTDFDEASEHAETYVSAVSQLQFDGFQVVTVGDVSATHEILGIADSDLKRAELFGLPMALVVLIAVFGALVAAGIPIIIGVVSIVVALGFAAGISQLFELDFFITNMISMIGLAVGIDYALFIIERFREERRRGVEKDEAIAIAGGTAAKAVMFSGMTVVLALTGLFLLPMTMFKGLAIGAILAVAVAVLAALTLIPALLGLLGDRINWPRRKAASTHRLPHEGFWGRITSVVMRRPLISMAIATMLLLAASVPLLDLRTGQTGIESLPEGQVKTAFDVLREEFSVGLLAPVEIVVDGELTNPDVAAGIETLIASFAADGQFGVAVIETNDAGDLAVVSVPLTTDANTPESFAAIESLRNQLIPQAFTGAPVEVLVTGGTAFMVDYNGMLSTWMPIVFAFVLGLSFILLTLVFRSVVVPALSIVMNLLSVGAAYGTLVLAFQKGYGQFLGFEHTPVIEAWIPVFLFCILFGLSMDYHVFLLSRIREHYDQTGRNDEAVAAGLHSTAKIITGAALIMVVVFGAFAAGRIVSLQQVGFGLAVSVLIDATIVRSVLVPSTMKLLGNRNWYLPSWLSRLPDVRIEGAPATAEPVPSPASVAPSAAD